MSTNDLRSNDLEKEFSRIETHARAKFEHEEFLHSAQHWKNCSSIAKELRRDDLRALAYRHLSFALRGCGQNTQADEAYRRAMKYETRAAPTSPNNNSSNNIRVPPSIAASSTESPRGTVKLLQSSINHHTHHHQDIDHHHVLLDTKVEQRDYLTGEEYEQGLQSLAEANARLRDQLETLQQQHKRVLAVQHETTETSARTRSEVERLSRALDEERDRCIVLDDELRAIKKATDTYKDSKDRECRMYEGTIEELQEQLKKQVAESLQQQDTIMSLEESVVVFKKEQETAKNDKDVLVVDAKNYQRQEQEWQRKEVEYEQREEARKRQEEMWEEKMEHKQALIMEHERAREHDAHHTTQTTSMASEVASLRDELSLRKSDVKRAERANEVRQRNPSVIPKSHRSLKKE